MTEANELARAINDISLAERIASEVRRREREEINEDYNGEKAKQRKAVLNQRLKVLTDDLLNTTDDRPRPTHEVLLDLAIFVSSIVTTLWTGSGIAAPHPRVFVGVVAVLAEHSCDLATKDQVISGIKSMKDMTTEPSRAN